MRLRPLHHLVNVDPTQFDILNAHAHDLFDEGAVARGVAAGSVTEGLAPVAVNSAPVFGYLHPVVSLGALFKAGNADLRSLQVCGFSRFMAGKPADFEMHEVCAR